MALLVQTCVSCSPTVVGSGRALWSASAWARAAATFGFWLLLNVARLVACSSRLGRVHVCCCQSRFRFCLQPADRLDSCPARQLDSWTHRHTDTQTDRRTDTQTDGQSGPIGVTKAPNLTTTSERSVAALSLSGVWLSVGWSGSGPAQVRLWLWCSEPEPESKRDSIMETRAGRLACKAPNRTQVGRISSRPLHVKQCSRPGINQFAADTCRLSGRITAITIINICPLYRVTTRKSRASSSKTGSSSSSSVGHTKPS